MEVETHDVVKGGRRGVEQRRPLLGPQAAGHVHEAMERPEAGRLRHRLVDLVLDADVGDDGRVRPTGQRLLGDCQALGVDVDGGHPGPRLRHQAADCRADATAARPRDDHHPTGEAETFVEHDLP